MMLLYHFHAKIPRRFRSIGTQRCPRHDTLRRLKSRRLGIRARVGYGNDLKFWRDIVSNLRLVGYDGVLSIEHEDSLMSVDEGLAKAVGVLKEAIMSDPKPSTMSWA